MLFMTVPAYAEQQRITLQNKVMLTDAEQVFVEALPPLKVAAYPKASPYSLYDSKTNRYSGVSVDIFRFIAQEIGLKYEFVVLPNATIENDLQRVKEGVIDVYMPVSKHSSRINDGLFTTSYVQDYYAVIARKGEQLSILLPYQLRELQVGFINKGSIKGYLDTIISAENLHEYTNNSLFDALRNQHIDVAIYLERVFEQVRFRREFFDFENVYTLDEYPRDYGFMFTVSPQHQQLVSIFDRFIPHLSIHRSMRYHSKADQLFVEQLIESKKEKRVFIIVILINSVIILLLLILYRRRKQSINRLGGEVQQLVDQQKSLEDQNSQLTSLTKIDALTGLANRRQFNEIFQREHKQHIRLGTDLSLLLLDIDYFKKVNDNYGHDAGDRYLQQVAQTLAIHLSRPTDLAVRYGGEEFACILPNTDFNGAMVMAEQIRLAIENLGLPTATAGGKLTISVGVASTEGKPQTVAEMIATADHYLYQAKNSGRNRVCGRSLCEKSSSALK